MMEHFVEIHLAFFWIRDKPSHVIPIAVWKSSFFVPPGSARSFLRLLVLHLLVVDPDCLFHEQIADCGAHLHGTRQIPALTVAEEKTHLPQGS
jgi:hypothetical protein